MCWGRGKGGGLGYGNEKNIGDNETPASAGTVNLGKHYKALQISAVGEHTCALLSDHTIRCWGDDTNGQLGYATTKSIGDNETPASAGPVKIHAPKGAAAVIAGGRHSCAVLMMGGVRCWGLASNGQLGYANTKNIGDDETPGSVGPVKLGGKVPTG